MRSYVQRELAEEAATTRRDRPLKCALRPPMVLVHMRDNLPSWSLAAVASGG